MRRSIVQVLLAAATCVLPALAAVPDLTTKELKSFLVPHGERQLSEQKPATLLRWENDARALLGESDIPHTAERLAEKYQLSKGEMTTLLKLWILSDTHEYLPGEQGARDRHEVDLAWVRFASDSGYKPLILQAMTASVGDTSSPFPCDTKLLDQLLEKAPDKISIGWQVVEQKRCREWLAWFLNQAGDRKFASLVAVTRDINEGPADKAAIYAWLASSTGLAHVDPSNRVTARIALTNKFATQLWGGGLVSEGLVAVGNLPSEERTMLLGTDQEPQSIRADNLAFTIDGTEAEPFRLDYAAALFASGRLEEARRILAQAKSLEPAKRYLACHHGEAQMTWGDPCGDPTPNFSKAILLDTLLNGPSDRLGSIAQTYFADGWFTPGGLLWAKLTCGAFDKRFPHVCQMAQRMSGADDANVANDLSATRAVQELPAFSVSRERYRAMIATARNQFPQDPPKLVEDRCGLEGTNFMTGKPTDLGVSPPGKPLSYQDAETGISFYVESDGRHLAAMGRDGILLWVREPFEDSHMCPYRVARPVIVAVEPSNAADDRIVGRELKRKVRGISIRYNSSQFGVVDIQTGDFVFMGQN